MSRKPHLNLIAILVVSALSVAGLFLFATASERMVAWRTFLLGVGASAISLPVGWIMAGVIRKSGFLPRILLFSCITLLFVPLFMQVSAWDAAFGKLGWISTGGSSLQPILSGWNAAIWVHGIAAAPQVALIIWFGLAGQKRVYEEQALLDASEASVFARITLWRVVPLLGLGMLVTMVCCAREMAVTDIFRIGTLAEQIYLGYSLGQLNNMSPWTAEDIAAAESTRWQLCVAIIFWFSMVVAAIGTGVFRARTQSNEVTERTVDNRGGALSQVLALMLWLVVAGVPIINLMIRASKSVENMDGTPTIVYTFGQFSNSIKRVFTDYLVEIQWSLTIALYSALVLLVFSVIASWFATRSTFVRYAFVVSIAACCALPGPLIGALLVWLFTSIDNDVVTWLYDRTVFPAILANLVFCWPFVCLFVYFAINQTPRDALESSQLDGAGSWTQLYRLVVLGNWKCLVGCYMLCMAYSFGELSASQMVLPPGVDTVPRLTLGLLHAGVNEMTAALTIVLMVGITVVSLFGWNLLALRPEHNG